MLCLHFPAVTSEATCSGGFRLQAGELASYEQKIKLYLLCSSSKILGLICYNSKPHLTVMNAATKLAF